MNFRRMQIKIEGVVQGVGFRPFIYQLAERYSLNGRVRNTKKGVEIEVEGIQERLDGFLDNIRDKAPAAVRINHICTRNIPIKGESGFAITESVNTGVLIAVAPPDIAVCSDCLAEISDPDNRRYQYPFNSCNDCGPRFSIIKDLPYDRQRTTMDIFKMCPECKAEYNDSLNRRYHAQTNTCPECGLRLWLVDREGVNQEGVDQEGDYPLKLVRESIKEGKIIAVRGIGGFHLICDATNAKVIARLRKRKRRPDKPLALLMKDLDTVRKYCEVDELEEKILQGSKKPILLLDKRGTGLPENLAPGSRYYGVMLPYTPLHQLLFDEELKVLVATSGNISGCPIEYRNQSAFNNLREIADYFRSEE